jgi:hydroxylaminobenzene mutase
MATNPNRSRLLMQLGALLFLVGLLVGFFAPQLASPRMALSSHLEGVMNGPFLIVTGLIWERLRLKATGKAVAFWLLVYGAYANVLATFLAAWWPAGATMPIAYQTAAGTEAQENVVLFLLFSCAFAMVVATLQIIWGLRGRNEVA